MYPQQISPRKAIVGFAWRFVLVMGLLILPWPGWQEGYGQYWRAAGQAVFGSFGAKGLVVFRANEQRAEEHLDTIVYIGNREMLKPGGQLPAASIKLTSRYLGYVPTALVVALITATPLPWRRRALALLWGLLAVHLFSGFLMGLAILHQYSQTPSLGLFQLGPSLKALVNAAYTVLVTYVTAGFVVAVFIWVAVTFRRGDMAWLLPNPARAEEP